MQSLNDKVSELRKFGWVPVLEYRPAPGEHWFVRVGSSYTVSPSKFDLSQQAPEFNIAGLYWFVGPK